MKVLHLLPQTLSESVLEMLSLSGDQPVERLPLPGCSDDKRGTTCGLGVE